jgi:hypothetical protein
MGTEIDSASNVLEDNEEATDIMNEKSTGSRRGENKS